MLPVIADLGYLKIYTQGLFLVLAFFWGTFVLWKQTTLTSFKEDDVFDGLFVAMAGGLFLGRLIFVMMHFEDFGFDILKFFLINGFPGVNMLGAVAGFLIFLYFFNSVKKITFSKLIDYVITPLFLVVAIAKLGSFFSGNEIGAQTNFFLSLKYPQLDGSRHLTPLYESILYFLGAFFSHQLLMQIRKDKYFNGFSLLFFLWFTALITVIFDPLKSFKSEVYGMSFDILIGSMILLTLTIYFVYYLRTNIFIFFKSLIFKKKKN